MKKVHLFFAIVILAITITSCQKQYEGTIEVEDEKTGHHYIAKVANVMEIPDSGREVGIMNPHSFDMKEFIYSSFTHCNESHIDDSGREFIHGTVVAKSEERVN